MQDGAPDRLRLFVYGTLLGGERNHALLEGAEFIGPASTAPRYVLVDLGPFAALVAGGKVSVTGELYVVDRRRRFTIDVKLEWPILFQRIEVVLADGGTAEAYAMREDQVRGKRRLAHGSWRDRFAPRPRRLGSALPYSARSRFDRG